MILPFNYAINFESAYPAIILQNILRLMLDIIYSKVFWNKSYRSYFKSLSEHY